MPLPIDPYILNGSRHVLSNILAMFSASIINSMLAVVGVVSFYLLLRRGWLVWLVSIVISAWPAIQGTFSLNIDRRICYRNRNHRHPHRRQFRWYC